MSEIDYEKLNEVYEDVLGPKPDGGFTIEDIQMRFEMANINWHQWQQFLHMRLDNLAKARDERVADTEWARGYVHAAMEFMLYGHLTGKEQAYNEEIDGDSK